MGNVSLQRAREMCLATGKGITLAYGGKGQVLSLHPGRVTLEQAQKDQSEEQRKNAGPVVRVEYETS